MSSPMRGRRSTAGSQLCETLQLVTRMFRTPSLTPITMAKRTRSVSPIAAAAASKKPRTSLISTTFNPTKLASPENAAAVTADPPLPKLLKAVQDAIKNPAKGDSIVYWMRMADLRSRSFKKFKIITI